MKRTLLSMLPSEPSSDDYDTVQFRVRMLDSSIITRRFHGIDTIQVIIVIR